MEYKKQEYNPELHEPLSQRNAEAIQFWLDLGKKLRIDSNYHVYFVNKWIANARPKSKYRK